MLIVNLCIKKGLCIGVRFQIGKVHEYFVRLGLTLENSHLFCVLFWVLKTVSITSSLPFIQHRRQFPVVPAFDIAINKSQEQSFDHIGICVYRPMFSYCQLYVALSGCQIKNGIKIQCSAFITNRPSARKGHIWTKRLFPEEAKENLGNFNVS